MTRNERKAIYKTLKLIANDLAKEADKIHNDPIFITCDYLQGKYTGILNAMMTIYDKQSELLEMEVEDD